MNSPTAKWTKKQRESLARIKEMRAQLDHAEAKIRAGRMYAALLAFEHLDGMAGAAANNIALETLAGARRHYDVFSIKDKNGKHVEWGCF
jgi:hypothetical protein